MSTFERLFGIKESSVKHTCILMPILKKDSLDQFDIKGFSRGRLYGSGNTNSFTLIHTGIGPTLLGDAVLYLSETPCKRIILFGSCGLVNELQGLRIGSLVLPEVTYSIEGFSDMLLKGKRDWKAFRPHKGLTEGFFKVNKSLGIKKVTCATTGSLKLEEDYTDIFKEKDIQVVDMESSALFSASRYIHKSAMALFYVTDVINKKPFYRDMTPKEKLDLSSCIKSAINILCKFIEQSPVS